jgi:hypothetical protein
MSDLEERRYEVAKFTPGWTDDKENVQALSTRPEGRIGSNDVAQWDIL